MPNRNVFILDRPESPWVEFLEEFFEDIPTTLHKCADCKSGGDQVIKFVPDLIFVNPELLSMAYVQKTKAVLNQNPNARVFKIGTGKPASEFKYDAEFSTPGTILEFQKELVKHLPLPEEIRVLIVDDEKEIGNMIRDFLEGRFKPAFHVEYAENGLKGLAAMEKQKPDVVISDIKMPEMDGRMMYRQMKERKLNIPTIIFFDAISGYEVEDIHQIGRPAIVEKGARQSAMPAMMALLKIMVYFG